MQAAHARLNNMLTITQNKFMQDGYWRNPIPSYLQDWQNVPGPEYVEIFDQNGYDLTTLECLYARANNAKVAAHRYKQTLRVNWVEQSNKISGAVLNHSFLFERKGYADGAVIQLQEWCQKNPTLYKVLQYRPKWGLDFSMDYVDTDGNCFEILHWEYDGFNYNDIVSVKAQMEPILLGIDWEDAGKQLLKRKSEWYDLDFFAQSDWKCAYFGIMPERFKMVAWQ